MDTQNYLVKTLSKLRDINGSELKYSPGYEVKKIPTLKKGVYRKASPMLSVRYRQYSSILDATHGDWLSISEMEDLWLPYKQISDERISGIKRSLRSNIKEWDNNAGSIFQHDRLSLFAGSAYTYEQVYLLWLDDYIEPQIWVYDANGNSRFDNLDDYLIAFLKGNSYEHSKPMIW